MRLRQILIYERLIYISCMTAYIYIYIYMQSRYFKSYEWKPKIVLASGSRRYVLVSVDVLPVWKSSVTVICGIFWNLTIECGWPQYSALWLKHCCRWKPAWIGSLEEPEETTGAREEEGLQWQGVKQGTYIRAAQTEACIWKESWAVQIRVVRSWNELWSRDSCSGRNM